MEIEKQIFKDVFNFLKNNINVRQDQEYWASINEQLASIEQRYRGDRFAVNMLHACTERLCELCDEKHMTEITESIGKHNIL